MHTLNWNNFTLAEWSSFVVTDWAFLVLNGDFYDPNSYFIDAASVYVPSGVKSIVFVVDAVSVFVPGDVKSDSH